MSKTWRIINSNCALTHTIAKSAPSSLRQYISFLFSARYKSSNSVLLRALPVRTYITYFHQNDFSTLSRPITYFSTHIMSLFPCSFARSIQSCKSHIAKVCLGVWPRVDSSEVFCFPFHLRPPAHRTLCLFKITPRFARIAWRGWPHTWSIDFSMARRCLI